MANRLSVLFNTCMPAPSHGYDLYYRVKATTGPYLFGGNFNASPAIVYIASDPDGTLYEGYIQSNCGATKGNQVPFVNLTKNTVGRTFDFTDDVSNPCAANTSIGLYYAGTLQVGTVIYSDHTLQTQFTLHPILIDRANGSIIYHINQSTGAITSIGAC